MADAQSLVLAAKRGDVKAYEALIRQYGQLARTRAGNVARRNPSVDASTLESALVWTVQRCFEEYDPSIAPFEHLVNSSWTKETMSTVRASMQAKRNEMSLNALPSGDDGTDALLVDNTVNVEAELLADLAVLEYRRMVRREDVVLEKVVVLLALGGYTQAEIARECGFEGSEEAAKMWTTRAVERIKRLIVPIGSYVRVKMPKSPMHGETGEVVRFADKTSAWTHIVRLDDGRLLSFQASELEVIELGD